MAYNKIEANGDTLIDLTNDTVTADTLLSGRTAHLASGEKVAGTFEPVTGVKGNAESAFRKGDVNLTPANIGAATSAQGAKADSAVQTIQIGGTSQTKTNGTVNLPAYPTKSSLGLGNVDNTSDADKPVSTATQTALNDKVSKSGDTMTGLLRLKNSNIDRDGEVSSTTTGNAYLTIQDKDNEAVSTFSAQQTANGTIRCHIHVINEKEDGTAVNNYFQVAVGKDGTPSYNMSSPSAFRAAIGLDNVNNTSDLNKPISTATQTALDNKQEQIDYNTNNGVKNLLKINIPEKTAKGLTFTPQSDGTIIINGTANVTSGTIVYWNLENPSNTAVSTQHSLNKVGYGNFIISLNGDEESMEGMYLQILYYDTIIQNPPANAQVSIGESKSITIDEDKKYVWFRLLINSSINGKTFDNFVLKPMIRDASIEGNTFQPYAKSNAELTRCTDDIQEQIECIDINAAYVPATGEVHITNTSDFTQQLFSKLYVYDEVRFAVLNLSVTSGTYHIKAIINTAAITQATALEATFINDDTLYRFYWTSNGTPTLTRRTLSFV